MHTEKDNFFNKRKNSGGIGFALFLILLGGTFLFFNLGIIPAVYKPLLISWQMLLFVIGLWILATKREYAGGLILMGIGVFFAYPVLSSIFPEYFVNFKIDFKTYWPIILIFIGIVLILAWLFPKKNSCCNWNNNKWDMKYNKEGNNSNSSEQATDYIDKNVMFGSSEQIVLSQNFKGGDANVMFGELIIDLRKAKLAEGEHKLELNAMFGSVVLYVPTEWLVEVRTSCILGSFDDKRYQRLEIIDSTSRLIVKGSAIFGNGEIRD